MTSLKLSEYADVFSGYAFKSSDMSKDGGIPLIKIKNISNKKIERICDQCIPCELLKESHKKFFLKNNDILVAMTGQGSVGRIGRMINVKADRYLVNQRVGIIRPREDKIDPYFLFSVLAQESFEKVLFSLGVGAGQPNISPKDIGDLPVPCIDFIKSKAIGSIRKNYDYLIENNIRRIEILEEMAQSLYREWFVKFRYPGYESQKLVESPLGLIPEGWEVKTLSEIGKVNPENISAKSAPERIYYIDISSVGNGTIDEQKDMEFSAAPSRARRKVSDGDIIWATVRPNRKQFAYISNPKKDTVVSTGFAVLRANKVPASFLYYVCTTDDFVSYLVNHATGSAYPAVNSGDFEKALLVVPVNNLLKEFDEFVGRLLRIKSVLFKKNDNLKLQRDMLLPKLISGSITI